MRYSSSVGLTAIRVKLLLLVGVFVLCLHIDVAAQAPRSQTSRLEGQVYQDPVSGRVIGINIPLRSLISRRHSGRSFRAAAVNPEQLAQEAIIQSAAQLGLLDPVSQLKKKSVERDEVGIVHIEFEQAIKGVPLFGSKIRVHVNIDSGSIFINGRVSEKNLDDVSPKLTPAEALATAEDSWRQEYSSEPLVKATPNLVALDTGLFEELNSGAMYLAYQVDCGDNQRSVRYFVDAKGGAVVYKLQLSSAATKRWVYDCSFGDGNCYRGQYSGYWGYYFGRSESQPPVGPNPINLSLIQAYPNETDRLYEQLGATYDYYRQTFNRDGANGVGGLGDGGVFPTDTIPATSYADYKLPGIGCPNAAFNPMLSSLEFCAGLMLIDTVGHEFTHAVIYYTANLAYQGQSGALNESFADIFGEGIERYATGSHDWLLGTSSRLGTLRSMIDPTNEFYNPYTGLQNGRQPDRFHSPLYQCGASDNGGVHSNSGVLNHAAYLIAAGGTFNGCSISGLGDDKMERIMYRALTRYLSSSSNFSDAYVAIRESAMDLYPLEDALEVEKALRAVELPQAGFCSGLAPSPSGCETLVDECPNAPDQLQPGACGCGVSSADANRNGQADCLDPKAATVPSLAVVTLAKTQARIQLQPVPGATYEVILSSKGSRPKTIVTKKNPYAAKLAKGSWTVTYRIKLGRVTTKSSKKKTFVVK